MQMLRVTTCNLLLFFPPSGAEQRKLCTLGGSHRTSWNVRSVINQVPGVAHDVLGAIRDVLRLRASRGRETATFQTLITS